MMIWLDLLQRHLIVQVKVIGRMVIEDVDRLAFTLLDDL